jgi:hypothetical protein
MELKKSLKKSKGHEVMNENNVMTFELYNT